MDLDEPVNVDMDPEEALRLLLGEQEESEAEDEEQGGTAE